MCVRANLNEVCVFSFELYEEGFSVFFQYFPEFSAFNFLMEKTDTYIPKFCAEINLKSSPR